MTFDAPVTVDRRADLLAFDLGGASTATYEVRTLRLSPMGHAAGFSSTP